MRTATVRAAAGGTACVCVLAGAAQSQVYNASAEFSATQNPAGPWAYGLRPGEPGSFTALPETEVISGIDFWERNLPFPDAYPKIGHNGTSETLLWGGPGSPVAAGEMIVHPGPSPAVLRWTAPATDVYRVIAHTRRASSDCGDGGNTGASVWSGATPLDSGALNGFGSVWETTVTVYRLAGQTVDLVIDNGGDGINCDHVATSLLIASARCGAADVGAAGGEARPDGHLDNNDFIAFITLFFNADPQADFGRAGGLAGSDGHFDNNDFIAFINAFFGGC